MSNSIYVFYFLYDNVRQINKVAMSKDNYYPLYLKLLSIQCLLKP